MSMAKRRRNVSGHCVLARAITPDDLRSRLAERDQRLANDNRSEAQRRLGDPPPDRSALSQRDTKPAVRFRGKADIRNVRRSQGALSVWHKLTNSWLQMTRQT
jgi:hypothetical protein